MADSGLSERPSAGAGRTLRRPTSAEGMHVLPISDGAFGVENICPVSACRKLWVQHI